MNSNASPSHNGSGLDIQNHIEPQRHHTISGSTSNGSNGGTTNLKTLAPSSPTKSSSANSSPKLGRRTQSTSSPRPRRHAPPPPSGAGSGSSSARKNKMKVLKDNRYSLQIEPNDINRPMFGSLPRRSGPTPPTRRESIPEGSIAVTSVSMSTLPTGASMSKPPLHPSASLGSTSSLQEAKLAGYSSFVNPHQTSSSSTLQPISGPTRRFSSDAVPGSIKVSDSPEIRRSSTGEVPIAGSPQQHRQAVQQQPPPEIQPQCTHSTSSTGSYGSGNATVMSSPRSSSNRGSSSPGSPRKNRSRSTSKERDSQLAQQQAASSAAAPPPVIKLELPTDFSSSDGMELIEVVRKRTGVSHRKSLIAINEVLEFLKNRVPMCAEMVDGLLSAVQQTQQVICINMVSCYYTRVY